MPWSWGEVGARWDEAVAAGQEAMGRSAATDPLSQVRLSKWSRLSLFRPNMPLVITGDRGAGKSVLYRALAGELVAGESLPGRSKGPEKHRVMVHGDSRKVRTAMTVLPGQTSRERIGSSNVHFGEGRTTRGVIHVVCWGHNKLWEAKDRELIKSQLSDSRDGFNLETLRRRNRRTELKGFRDLRAALTDTWAHREGVWLIIAVAKCDLYWSSLHEARDYYIPSPSGVPPNEVETAPFAWELRTLVNDLGSLNIGNLAVLPVSSRPDTYDFDSSIDRVDTQLIPNQSDVLINVFRNVVGEFCGG
ncbi:MAG: hypothetical protein ACRDOO_26645 [Actinomadura sp.]